MQRGSGTTILTGANTYAGLTTVEAGALFVNGSITSAATVRSGATFGGGGFVGGITLEPGATLVFSLGTGTSDLLTLTGDFTKAGAGAFSFTFTGAGWQVGETYTLILFGGGTDFTGSDFSYTNGDDFDGTFTLNDHGLTFTLASVPEPSSLAWPCPHLPSAAERLRPSASG